MMFAQFRLCVLQATHACCYEEVRNYGKILSKALLKMAGGEGMHSVCEVGGGMGGHVPLVISIAKRYTQSRIKRGGYGG